MSKNSRRKIFTTLGASNHTESVRETLDFYATHPSAATKLMEVEKFKGAIWEPAAGNGHLAKELKKKYIVYCSDIIQRNYILTVRDFLKIKNCKNTPINIVTNPPFNLAQEFIEMSLEVVADGYKVCMFLKLTFCEGKKRNLFFKKHPPKYIYVFSSRIRTANNGDFEKLKESGGSAICFAWFVWVKGYNGETTLRWIN